MTQVVLVYVCQLVTHANVGGVMSMLIGFADAIVDLFPAASSPYRQIYFPLFASVVWFMLVPLV